MNNELNGNKLSHVFLSEIEMRILIGKNNATNGSAVFLCKQLRIFCDILPQLIMNLHLFIKTSPITFN